MEWQQHAACRGVNPDLFFPQRGENGTEAKRVCAGCVVRVPCLEYAIEADEFRGVWGGMSERERRALERSRRKHPATPVGISHKEPGWRERLRVIRDGEVA